MGCPEFETRILESIDSRPAAGECHVIEQHIETCANCREFRERQKSLGELLAASLTAPALTSDFRSRLMRNIAGEIRRSPQSHLPELLDFTGFAAMAAAGAFCLNYLLQLPAAEALLSGNRTLIAWVCAVLCLITVSWLLLGNEPRRARQ